MLIGNTSRRTIFRGKNFPLWTFFNTGRGLLNSFTKLRRKKTTAHRGLLSDMKACYFFSSVAAVVKAGRISFGTDFILSSAFCTSGRITTYLLIMSRARL